MGTRTVGNCVYGWRNDYQKTAAEERKVCAERQCVKVSQEVVNDPIKSTRTDTPPELADATRGHGPPTSTRHWVTVMEMSDLDHLKNHCQRY